MFRKTMLACTASLAVIMFSAPVAGASQSLTIEEAKWANRQAVKTYLAPPFTTGPVAINWLSHTRESWDTVVCRFTAKGGRLNVTLRGRVIERPKVYDVRFKLL